MNLFNIELNFISTIIYSRYIFDIVYIKYIKKYIKIIKNIFD